MSASRLALIVGLIAAAFAGGWIAATRKPEVVSATSVAAGNSPAKIARVIAQGRIVPANGIHNVVAPLGQRIETVLVGENDDVTANDTRLVTLSGEQVLDLQTELIDAQAEEATAEIDQKILIARTNLTQADGAVESAQLQVAEAQAGVDLSVAKKQIAAAYEKLSRLQSLEFDPDTRIYISSSDLQDQQLAIEKAESDLAAAQRKQASAIQASQLALKIAQQSQVSAQQALLTLEALRQQERSVKLSRQIAEDRRDAARVISPVSGTVLKVFARQGDVVGNTPIMQIGNLDDMECIAEVVDRLVGTVKIGQSATITSPALSQPLSGTVISIGRFVGQNSMLPPSPLALVDRRTVDVRVRIDTADVELASKLVNLQVSVEIAAP